MEHIIKENLVPIVGRSVFFLLLGLVLALLVRCAWFIAFIFRFLHTIIHEMGHTLVGLGLGYFAIPTVNNPLYVGGGAAYYLGHWRFLILVIIGWLCFLVVRIAQSRQPGWKPWAVAFATITVIYTLIALIPQLKSVRMFIFIVAGHVFEILAIMICFYRCIIPDIATQTERPLYSLIGWFIFFDVLRFIGRLKGDSVFRSGYMAGSLLPGAHGGSTQGDLAKMADLLRCDVIAVANFWQVLLIVTVVAWVSFLFLRMIAVYQER